MTDETENEELFEEQEENVDADETPADRFKRIANPRFRKAVKAIRVLKNCSAHGYEYSEEQVTTIVTTLQKEIEDLEKAFNKVKDTDDLPEI